MSVCLLLRGRSPRRVPSPGAPVPGRYDKKALNISGREKDGSALRTRLRLSRGRRKRKDSVLFYTLGAAGVCLLLFCLFLLGRYALNAVRSSAVRQSFQELYSSRDADPPQATLRPAVRQFEISFPKASADSPPGAYPVPVMKNWPDNPSMTVSAKFKKLQRQNRDIVGWLELPDMAGQPVVQRDNTYYLKRDCLGYHNVNGALFLEETISLKSRPDTYIIFGHNMKTGEMFGSLRMFENVSYYRENAVIDFNVLYEDGQYVVFAVADIDTVQGMSRYVPFMLLSGMEAGPRSEAIRKLQAYSAIVSPVQVDAEDQLLLLVTCDGTEDSRRVVAARRLRPGETKQAITDALRYARKR